MKEVVLGKELKVVEYEDDKDAVCDLCYFSDKHDCYKIHCLSRERADGKSVYFVEEV